MMRWCDDDDDDYAMTKHQHLHLAQQFPYIFSFQNDDDTLTQQCGVNGAMAR